MISVVVPIYNEQDNIAPLLAEIAAVPVPVAEIIYVDDGSTDRSPAVLREMRAKYPNLRVIRHERCSGQSAGLWTGIKTARGPVIVTLDGDGQNDPADIKQLYDIFEKNGGAQIPQMVMGQRLKRRDTLMRRLASRFANGLRAFLLRDGTRDTGCSLKMFRREDYLDLPYFNHMHRYLPALLQQQGAKVYHVDVSHRPRTHGVSKYNNLQRALVGISDLAGVMWLGRRSKGRVIAKEEV